MTAADHDDILLLMHAVHGYEARLSSLLGVLDAIAAADNQAPEWAQRVAAHAIQRDAIRRARFGHPDRFDGHALPHRHPGGDQ